MNDTAQAQTTPQPAQASTEVQFQAPQPVIQQPPPTSQPQPKKRKIWLVVLIILVFLVAVTSVGAYAIVWYSNSVLEIDNQVIEGSILLKRVVLRYRTGGYIVIQANSPFPNTGNILVQTSILPPAIYERIPLVFDPNLTIIEPGQVLYGLLYAESDGLPELTKGDSFIQDIFGKALIVSFRAL